MRVDYGPRGEGQERGSLSERRVADLDLSRWRHLGDGSIWGVATPFEDGKHLKVDITGVDITALNRHTRGGSSHSGADKGEGGGGS